MRLDLELYRETVTVAPDVEISYIQIAPERPLQTLVLLHGFGGRARQWRYQIEAFIRDNRVIAIDLRGHGRSSRPRHGYDIETMLADVTAVLADAKIDRPFVLMGHSFGVALATEFAHAHPERVSRLILIAGAGEYKINPSFRFLFRLPPPVLRALQPVANRVLDASLRAMKRFYQEALKDWQGWDIFPQLKPPTMVILGNRDRVLPQEAFERVAELVPPESEIVNVGVSAHMVMLERRDAVNRAIERFLEMDMSAGHFSRWRSNEGGRGSLLAERPWLAHYEAAVPATIDVPRLPLTRLLDRAYRRFPGHAAIHFMGRRLSYRQFSAQAARFANGLQALGVTKGDRVLLMLPNVPQLVIAYYGALRIGAVVVMTNPLARPDEIVRQAQVSGAKVVVALTKFAATAVQVKAQSDVRHLLLAHVADYMPFFRRLFFLAVRARRQGHALDQPLGQNDFLWRPWLRQFDNTPPAVAVTPGDTAVIQFTSGTTAKPKGIMLSHYNLVANTMQVNVWLTDAHDGEEVVLCVTPFSHVYGMTAGMNFAVSQAACMVLMPRFEVDQVLAAIKRTHPTLFPGVPTMYVAINNFPNVRRYNVQSINACISGAAPLPIEVKEAFEKLTKGKLVEGYGLSEASPVTHANPINGRSKIGSIGLPLPSTEARIVDLQTGTPLPPGQIGELVVRGPQVMQGYWQDKAATAKVIDKQGWLHTNDIARMDEDGYFQIISRRQDMWQVDGAAPAFPRDVEEVIYEIPEVREVVVIAIANQPIAFVSVKEKNRLPAKTIIAFCERRLPPSQVPKLVLFVNEFPRSLIGKVLRRELVSRYASQITVAEAGSVGEHLAGLED